jgi:hypothetical protein
MNWQHAALDLVHKIGWDGLTAIATVVLAAIGALASA